MTEEVKTEVEQPEVSPEQANPEDAALASAAEGDELEALKTRNSELTAELFESKTRITTLETELAESEAAFSALEASVAEAEDDKQAEIPKLSSYKTGDYVTVVIPSQIEKENGRVVEQSRPGQLLSVATAKGEFAIGSPDRVRKQGQSW